MPDKNTATPVISISIQAEDFDVSQQLALLRQQSPRVGAIASFVGIVRDLNDGNDVSSLELEHYPGMTEKSIAAIIEQAQQRWQLYGTTVIHRIGQMAVTEQIVLVAVSSMHRGDAFAACEFIMDYLKTQAPLWKKELTASGSRWVDARNSDQAALQRWSREK
jgi:molybdopterin synthase catalytic subunit